jgi:predicted alpha/beta-hydrolase family hydrolase
MPERFRVEIAPTQGVTAIAYPAAEQSRAGVTLILGHGAGADQTSSFMVTFATELAARDRHGHVQLSLHRTRALRPRSERQIGGCFRAVIGAVRMMSEQ